MTNDKPDLEAYVLGELAEPERRLAEQYVASNQEAAIEVERLRAVLTSLRALPEEEPPRRIAFVSDKVFEPKWYQAFWNSAARLGFAAAAMLSIAIVTHAVLARTGAPGPLGNTGVAMEAEVQKRVEAEFARKLEPAVAQAVARVKAEGSLRSQETVRLALAEAEKKFALERQADRLAMEASFDLLRKQMARVVYIASNDSGGRQ
jgi:hypothetical protein